MSFRDLNVVIADNSPIFRAGIRSLLLQHEGLEVLAEASSLEELNTMLTQSVPNVLILNLSINQIGSLDFISKIAQAHVNMPIIALGLLSEEAFAARVLRAGGAAYLKVDCPAQELIDAVHAAKSGRMYLTSRASSAVIEQLQNRSNSRSPHFQLSDREHQIFMMICRGVPLVKIGESFGISVKTVSTYRARILKKMNMQSNAELIQYAVKNQMVESIPA